MSVRDRVAEHRKRLRAQGLRPIQVWVPDVRSDVFADEALRQSRAVALADRHGDDQDFVDATTVSWDDVSGDHNT
jgi:hypothetical protein